MEMRLTKGFNIILSIILFVTAIAITPYGKSVYTFAINEIQNSVTPEISIDTLQFEKQPRLEKLKIFHNQQNLEEQLKLAEQLKFEDQKKLEVQKKLEEQKLAEKLKQENQEAVVKQQSSSLKSETSSSNETKPKALLVKTEPKLLIDKINGKGNAGQAIVVTTNSLPV
jgi:hypothetical protein